METAETVVSYLIISIGLAFSLATVLLLVINWRCMIKNSYSRLMFIIQLTSVGTCIGGMPFFAQLSNANESGFCKAAGVTFYFCSMVKNLSKIVE